MSNKLAFYENNRRLKDWLIECANELNKIIERYEKKEIDTATFIELFNKDVKDIIVALDQRKIHGDLIFSLKDENHSNAYWRLAAPQEAKQLLENENSEHELEVAKCLNFYNNLTTLIKRPVLIF